MDDLENQDAPEENTSPTLSVEDSIPSPVVITTYKQTYSYTRPVNLDLVKEIARGEGMRLFLLQKEDGTLVSKDMYPLKSGVYFLKEYN
ncbi:MAG: hypothetical protein ACP5JH_12015, partial [Bacteroidota bacterium]